ncbi:hypothetical protein PFISCL1PPCAC_27842, partial [Pristionchus fissidentatus]
FREISQTSFSNGLNLFDHDVLIWLGDLNYRVNSQVNGLSNSDVRRIASSSEMTKLTKFDQLREQQLFGRVFVGFKEAPIAFPPTYKYDIGTHLWDSSEKARCPAWCDRVLWWTSDDGTKMSATSYTSVQSVTLSDHKPVIAELNVEVRKMNQKLADSLYEEAIREADRRANELLPQISLSCQEVDFGDVYFMKTATISIVIKNEGKSGVRFKLKERPGIGICAEWLNVFPQHYHLSLGQQVVMTLGITVDKRTSWSLEGKHPILSDILVLSLEKGRDHFIPVSASYTHRVFGVSLSHLFAHKADLLISFEDAPSLPVPRSLYALVLSIRMMGVDKLSFGDLNDEDHFDRIRESLERECPDLTKIHPINIFALYSALLRLIDSLKDPLVPEIHRSEWLLFSHDSSRLWSLIDSYPRENREVIVFLTDFLRELFHCNSNGRDQLRVWADVIVRETSTSAPSSPRLVALRSLVDYSRDTALFHLS